MKKLISCILLLVFALPAAPRVLAQNTAAQHKAQKNAEKYRKSQDKQRKKEMKRQAKQLKAFKKQHHVG